MLKICGLNKKYSTADGEIVALDNVSLQVTKGEYIAIVGRSGSGKTTLLNMIGGLDIPDSGSIVFDGVDIVRLSGRKTAILRRQKIGVIYQFYNLIPELNIVENITLPTELDRGEIDKEWLSEILRIVGLSGREGAYPNTLSGGQQQRVAIARALINMPLILFADEPTGNLDRANADEVLSLLLKTQKVMGQTLIMVTHDMSIAMQADRVFKMENGILSPFKK